MIASKIPRYLLFALMLGFAVTVIMLSMFYGQYRWLAGEIVTRSSAEYDSLLEANFERQARSQMADIAGSFALDVNVNDSAAVLQALNNSLARDETMTGLRFTSSESQILQTGNIPATEMTGDLTWLQDDVILEYPIVVSGETLGMLAGSFQLDEFRAESRKFVAEVAATEIESRRVSYLWIGLGTLATVIVCGFVVWLIANDQTSRIRELKRQAEKLREADFGEPLPETRGDELGELAAVFNAMRDRLKSTTISRDYVDSILSSMSDSIVVTSRDGTIKRINNATTRLLGYDLDELIDTSIDFVVNTQKSGSLVTEKPTGLPR